MSERGMGLERGLAFIFFMAPLWWITGAGIFIYHAAVLWGFAHVLIFCTTSGRPLQVPKILFSLGIFLLLYLFSILINAGSNTPQRVFASLNNYLMVVMGFLLVLCVYQCDPAILLREFSNAARILGAATGVLGLVFLILWLQGYRDIQWETLLARRLPFLLDYPYFYSLLTLIPSIQDTFAGVDIPRFALYSQAPTGNGGLMVLILPLIMAYYSLVPKKRWQYGAVFALSLFVLVFSLSRAAFYAFFGAWVLVEILSRGKKLFFVFSLAAVIAISSGWLDTTVDWILNSRKSSTVGRFEVYEEAFRIVTRENLWTGMGARLRDEFTMRAVGSHALYIEVLFVTGLLGTLSFLLFQFLVMLHWYRQRKFLKDSGEIKIWKCLGMSLIGVNIWLLTDTFFALPLIAYGYFLLTGLVLRLPFLPQAAAPQNSSECR